MNASKVQKQLATMTDKIFWLRYPILSRRFLLGDAGYVRRYSSFDFTPHLPNSTGANLGGDLGEYLGYFVSIQTMLLELPITCSLSYLQKFRMVLNLIFVL